MDGIAYDLDGNPLGRVDDLEQTFLDQAKLVAEETACYVISGGTHPEFDEKIRQLGVTVVVDASFGESAVIVEGEASEWSPT